MTNNQVQYWALRESARHNQEVEAQGRASIQETVRHNLVSEDQQWTSLNISERNLVETMRHNLVAEDQQQQSINESVRHNKQSEAIGFGQIRATVQAASISAGAAITSANIAAETTRRGQDINAFISGMNIGVAQQNADTNALNAKTEQKREFAYEQDSAARQFGMIVGGVGSGIEAYGGMKAATTQ